MANLKNTSVVNSTFKIPQGNTSQRVENNSNSLRYNTEESTLEQYTKNFWLRTEEFPGQATGGTVVDVVIDGQDYRIHSFENVGTSTFQCVSNLTVDVLVVAGGGGGGNNRGGGGGAGELIFLTNYSISAGTYDVTVGQGGAGASSGSGSNGGDSSFDGNTAAGGGGGSPQGVNGLDGGSGGGGGCNGGNGGNAIPNQGFGNDGSDGPNNTGGTGPAGSGGGAGTSGTLPITSSFVYTRFGHGGFGLDYSSIFTTSFGYFGQFAGGGGGGLEGYTDYGDRFPEVNDLQSSDFSLGRAGGGRSGSALDLNQFDVGNSYNSQSGEDALENTGSGGGGGNLDTSNPPGGKGGNGGSGIVLIRYQI